MLYFGSFNPIHKGHIALAEYAISEGLCDQLILVVSPQNPLKSKGDLAPEMERLTMAEIACAESKYPSQIQPSVIEFLLPKPSYTINTLRHLRSEYGSQMEFSILMGGDLVKQLSKWRDYEEILRDYNIYVYPRRGESIKLYLDRITPIENAPLFDVSSTEIRRALVMGDDTSAWLHPKVAAHIKQEKLWNGETYLEMLDNKIDSDPKCIQNYIERGKWHYRHEAWGEALNDFNRALAIEADHTEALQMAQMVKQILEFRYKDIYNP